MISKELTNHVSGLLSEKKIIELESEMLKCEQVECPVIHRFGPGTYIREVKMPAGAFVVGHHQNLEHTNIFLEGSMTLLMDGIVSEIKAPMIFVAKPGRKIAKIHQDAVWLNIYPNVENCQDVETLETKYLTKSDTFKISEESKNAVLVSKNHTNMSNVVELPFGAFKIKTTKTGLFATANIDEDEIIGPMMIAGRQTIIGRHMNHSENPNSKIIYNGNGNIELIAIKKISGCHGGFDGEEITINYGGLKCQE